MTTASYTFIRKFKSYMDWMCNTVQSKHYLLAEPIDEPKTKTYDTIWIKK